MKLAKTASLLLALALFAVACGGDDGGGTTSPPAGGGDSTLTMVDNAFQPAELSVAAGTEVSLTNSGGALHNFSVDGQDADVDVQAGQSGSVTIDLPAGTYTMFCKYHRSAGMEGTLTVTG